MDPETVLAAIRAAFADVPRLGVSLREADVIDAYGSDEERADARLLDTDTHWTDISDGLLDAHCSTVSFFG